LNHLGLTPRDYQLLLRMLAAPNGLILVTGPTGAGKTTTLYACLNHLNTGLRKINTIEDPVEFALAGVRQSQVNPAVGLGFAELLRGVLRQGPDVIMIGEVRDAETATTAVRAANSGHLVLATLHAPGATAAVQAMLHLGAQRQHLAASLAGVVAQRLVRTLSPDARVEVPPDAYTGLFEEVLPHLRAGEGERIYGPDPEAERQGRAYAARVGLFEVMAVTPALRQMIFQQQPAQALRHKAQQEGMVSLRQAALLALARGTTSLEEVFRVIPTEALLED
jgi:type II secretory ATPase GspE/PulE/Tfp pilus assembly ATPase PilB-like protein